MRFWLLIIVLLVVSSMSYAITFVVEDTSKPTFETFTVSQGKSGAQKAACLFTQNRESREFWFNYREDQEELERCFHKITKNWKRELPDGKLIVGGDDRRDADFKHELWVRLRNGEDIC
ncbi:MAG TPA: hypothetical protein VJH97_04240 [Candidatus Nanoarchaeia archaeon]|nr:hypothetical protein [Candidatus Nanoarchaeia archaeon]